MPVSPERHEAQGVKAPIYQRCTQPKMVDNHHIYIENRLQPL